MSSPRRPKKGRDRAANGKLPSTTIQVESRSSDREDLILMLKNVSEVFKAFADLCESLVVLDQVAAAEFSKSQCEKLGLGYGEYDRARASLALKYVIDFLMRVTSRDGLPTPLIKLWNALGDLDRGVVAPMLQVEQRSKSDPSGHMGLKIAAAATMSRLMETGLNRIEAARRVADCLNRGSMTFGDRRSKESWRTVAAWRDQAVKATKSKSENDPLGEIYEDWLVKVIMPPPPDMLEYERYREGILEILLRATQRYDDA
jgi:hypothetical protein